MKTLFFITILGLALAGCVSPKSYVNPQYSAVNYGDIKPVEDKYEASIEIEFQRNGEHFSRGDKVLQSNVERIFRASGVIIPVGETESLSIKVVCNNIADLKAASAKGFATGLTFGAAGTAIADYYSVTIELKQGEKIVSKVFKHSIHTTIGNKAAPFENVEPSAPNDAFGYVIEDVILQFIKEMQAENMLTLTEWMSKQV